MLPLRPRRHLRPLPRRLSRRALAWYAAAVTLTALTAGTVHSSLRDAAEAEAAYGETVRVVVATAAVAAGDPVDASVAEGRDVPRALMPDGALTGDPTGRAALVALSPGEVVLGRRVAGPDAEGLAARLGPGQRAIAVPVVVPGLDLARGDRVDLVAGATVDGVVPGDLPVGASAGSDLVATDGEVLEPGEETVVIAVEAASAADVAAALAAGPVAITLRPPGG